MRHPGKQLLFLALGLCWLVPLPGKGVLFTWTEQPAGARFADASVPGVGQLLPFRRLKELAMSDVSQILNAIQAGDPEAAQRLYPLVYEELHRMAAGHLAQESPGQSLEATGLVHEAYLRLVDQTNQQHFANRRHFFGAAAEAMRRILVDRARARHSCKRGGDRQRLDLDHQDVLAPERSEELLALDEALDRLAAAEPQAAELVQLRYFACRTMTEAAALLGLSRRSAHRLWDYARAWLLEELSK
jgi:RNA polymerase sigma factor (TIGR02999 family)